VTGASNTAGADREPVTTLRVEAVFAELHQIARHAGALVHVSDGRVELVMRKVGHQVAVTHTVVV
jgi:hypothetical protein